MGVMSCSRNACGNIMCDTYVGGDIGYICYECKNEFKEYLNKQNIEVKTEYEIRTALGKFMDTEKNSFSDGNEMSVDDFFRGCSCR